MTDPSPGCLRVLRDVGTSDGAIVWFVVAGELDISNVDVLIGTVEPAAVSGGQVGLELSRLEFMDCSGIAAFARFANALAPGGLLVLRSPQRCVRRVLDLVEAHRLPGIVVLES